jgi:hypothetical protein
MLFYPELVLGLCEIQHPHHVYAWPFHNHNLA